MMSSILIKIANWWLRLSKRMKVATILVVVFLLMFLYKSVQYSLLKYHYFKEKERQVEVYKDSLKVSQRRIDLLINSAKEENEKAIKRIDEIEKKLQDDKKKIYNSSISDDELRDFLSKYEEKTRKNKGK